MSGDVSQATEAKWAQILTAEYAEGASDVEIMAALRMSRPKFDENYANNPIFRELVDIGRIQASAFWHRIARKNILSKEFNTSVWSFTMKNRFGWAEKSTDELRQQLVAMLPGVAKQLHVTKKESDLLILPEGAVNAEPR
jgi:hypothetical protein